MIFEILERRKIKKSREIAGYLEEKEVYFTHSMLNNFVDLAFEFENSTDKFFCDILWKIKLDMKKSKKDRGAELIRKIEEVKMPVYSKTLKEFEKRVKKIKSRQISIKYPRELEGEEIFLEISLRNFEDVEKSLDSLNKNKKIIGEMMSIFENGIWEE